MIELESGIKVWQPRGFQGLEVELLHNPPFLHLNYLISDYEITVQHGGYVSSFYRGESYRSNASWSEPVLYLQSPGEMFSGSTKEEDRNASWSLRISPESMSSMLQDQIENADLTVGFPQAIPGTSGFNHWLAIKTRNVINGFMHPRSLLERESDLLGLVTQVTRSCGDLRLPEFHCGRESKAIKQVRNHLREHYSIEVSLNDLATLVGLNKFHLLKVFKREVGISPHTYQTLLRVKHAKKRLASGTPIAQIAHEVGFVDQSHLNRQFKKHVRVTPGQFQRDSLRDG